MRKPNELLTSRTRVEPRFALLPLEGIPYSRLPEWPKGAVRVLAGPALGARFAEYLLDLPAGSGGSHPADGEIESFIYLLRGTADLSIDGTGSRVAEGGFVLVPPTSSFELTASSEASLLLLRKRYEPAAGIPMYGALVGNEREAKGEIYAGDDGAKLQTLIPDELQYDMAMNIFTFESGHGLPVTETHVMEHGLYVLQGKGVYFLGSSWMEVEATDFVWMGPFCPQSYYAAGSLASRYIYYTNVNREIAV